jgi:hypothetical protein
MTDRTHPDSGRIITSSDILLHDAKTALMYEELRAAIDDGHESMTHADALAEVAAMRAENIKLRAQLEAIGAGGVNGPLMGRASLQSHGFTAADMATASAQGFRDGVASISANAEGWRPISTAPRDGTEVLADTSGLGRVVVYWDDEESQWGTGLGYLDRGAPTHWMPLPPPPTSAEGVDHG